MITSAVQTLRSSGPSWPAAWPPAPTRPAAASKRAAPAAPSARGGGSRPGPRSAGGRRRARDSVISSPGCAGRQCSANASGAGLVEQLVGDRVRRERLAARGGGVLGVAHRHPHVGVDGVGAGDRLRRDRRSSTASVSVELVAVGRRDAHLHPRQRADARRASGRRCCRRRRRRATRPSSEPERLAQRQQVGERLARVVQRREHVHHRHGGVLGERRRARPRRPCAGRSPRRGGRGPARCRARTRRA